MAMLQFCTMFPLKINNDTYQCPSSWNELAGDQLLRIAELSPLHLPPAEFKISLLRSLFGLETMKVKEKVIKGEICFLFKHGRKNIYIISALDISFIIQKFDFLFQIKKDTGGNNTYTLRSRLTKNLIPEIKIGSEKFYGPSDGLTNLIFQEYIHTETLISKFNSTGDIAFLDKLIAVLYRPQSKDYNPDDANFSGDRREPFNDFIIDARASAVSKIDNTLKHAILMFYMGCTNHIQFLFKEVFTGNHGSADESKNTFKNMMKLVTALTNNDVTKNEQVRKTYLYEVMIALQEMKIQSDKVKEDIEKIKIKNKNPKS